LKFKKSVKAARKGNILFHAVAIRSMVRPNDSVNTIDREGSFPESYFARTALSTINSNLFGNKRVGIPGFFLAIVQQLSGRLNTNQQKFLS
jgi:hypothetical protein